ncbi:MAG: ankyrin repeat domain-containing protein [Candidatus Electrothrix scaldis]|nr:MAG: ankyrin repeat domain-containing protein [Candidatus Electrothrix sp. GW3-3]
MKKNNMRIAARFIFFLLITTLFPIAKSIGQSKNIIRIQQEKVFAQHISAPKKSFLPYEATESDSAIDEPLLHAAILKEQTEAIRSLLKNKEDLNQADKKGRTPLLLAIQTGNADIVRLLLDNGADVNLKGIGLRSIQAVVSMGAPIQAAYPRPPEKQELKTTLHSPLFEAVDLGKTEIAHILLLAGADVSSEDKDIMSRAFTKALQAGEKGIVTALREHGAKISGFSQLQQALRYGIIHKMYDLVDFSLKRITDSPQYSWYLDRIFLDLFQSWKLEIDRDTAGLFVQYKIVGPSTLPKRNSKLLRRAIQAGTLESIRIFLEKGVKPDVDALKQAIKYSEYEIAQLFLQHGVELDALGENLCNYLSSSKTQDELFDFFIKNNADLKISCALRLKKAKWVEQLLTKGAKPRPQDEDAINVVKDTVAHGETEILQLLLGYGYPVNSPGSINPDEKTALCKAMTSQKSSPELVTLLLDSGADIHHPCVDKDFRRLLTNNHEELALLLLKKGIKSDYKKCLSFIRATRPKQKGSMTMMDKILLQAKQGEKYTSKTDKIPTEKSLNTELVNLLLQDISINEKDSRGQTLLMHAAQTGHTDFTKKLLEHDADVNFGDENEVTALMLAAAGGHARIVELLLEHEAQINAVDKKGKMSALLYAVKSGGNLETVKTLVERGADIRQIGLLGFDAVTIAMISDQSKIADYLIAQGADRTAYDNLESERVRFIENFQKLFPKSPEQPSPKDLSLLEYIQFKMMLKMSAGIDNPADWHPNPELSSPEKTWAYYKKMLLQGELEKALACHLPGSAEIFRKIYQKMDQKGIIEMVEKMRAIEKITMDRQQAKYRLKRKIKGNDITFYVYFVNTFGEWRIKDF